MREAMKAGTASESQQAQGALQDWETLLDEFAVGDQVLRCRMQQALESDTDLQSGWAFDAELQTFVARARESRRQRGATLA
jgi:hypothetical protein